MSAQDDDVRARIRAAVLGQLAEARDAGLITVPPVAVEVEIDLSLSGDGWHWLYARLPPYRSQDARCPVTAAELRARIDAWRALEPLPLP